MSAFTTSAQIPSLPHDSMAESVILSKCPPTLSFVHIASILTLASVFVFIWYVLKEENKLEHTESTAEPRSPFSFDCGFEARSINL